MSIGDPYATLAELKLRLDVETGDVAYDSALADALAVASADIELYCARQFNDAGSASARVLYPTSADWTFVDDFSTTVGLVVAVDTAGDGTYATTLTLTDLELHPLNGVAAGRPGWPYCQIRAIGVAFPVSAHRAALRVTARWGWAAVPKPIHDACLMLAQESFKSAEAAFGVAGFGEFGAVRVRTNPMVAARLAPYRLAPVQVA
jgi:hypothetical protein